MMGGLSFLLDLEDRQIEDIHKPINSSFYLEELKSVH